MFKPINNDRIVDIDNISEDVLYAMIINNSVRPCIFKVSNINEFSDEKSVVIGRRLYNNCIDWTVIHHFHLFAEIIDIYPINSVITNVLFSIADDSDILEDMEALNCYINQSLKREG